MTIVLQPSTQDCYVDHNYPTINYNSTLFAVDNETDEENRAYVQFDLSSLVGLNIASAAFHAYCYAAASNGAFTAELQRCTASWVEATMTWNVGQPAVAVAIMAGLSLPNASTGWKIWTLDLTEFGTMIGSNNGFRMDYASKQTSGHNPRTFYSSEYVGDTSLCPKLVVELTIADPVAMRYVRRTRIPGPISVVDDL